MSEAYTKLTNFFNKHTGQVVELEIFPTPFEGLIDSSGIFEEGVNLGIQKKVLVEAFISARQLFDSRATYDHVTTINAAPILSATQVILLCDPEHLTAANYRKRCLVAGSINNESTQLLVQNELTFLASILTSPMPRQNKSPTLWYHRYWVIQQHHTWSRGSNEAKALFKAELELVFRSGERHPKNYNAWQYARNILSLLDAQGFTSEDLSLIVNSTTAWCLRHISDTSGWSFVSHLLAHPLQTDNIAISAISRVLEVAIKYKYANESLWTFLRTSIAELSPDRADTKQKLVEQLQSQRTQGVCQSPAMSLQEDDQRLSLQQKLDHAIDVTLNWIEKHSKI